VRWCSDLNQRRGGGLPETALHGGARRAEALDGGRLNEGWGTSLSRSMRSSRVWRWSQEVLVARMGSWREPSPMECTMTWSGLALSRGMVLSSSGDLELDGDNWLRHRRKEVMHASEARHRGCGCGALASTSREEEVPRG
jgi:hypothetical protein